MDKQFLRRFDKIWIDLNRNLTEFEDIAGENNDKVLIAYIRSIDKILHDVEKDHLDKFYPKVLRESECIQEFVNIQLPPKFIVGEIIEQVYEKDNNVYIVLSNDRVIKIDSPEISIAIKGKWIKRIDFSIVEGNRIEKIFNDTAGITLILDNNIQFNLDFPKSGGLIESVKIKEVGEGTAKIKNQIVKYGNYEYEFYLRPVSANGNKRGCSGFIVNTKSKKIAYINTDTMSDKILVREAKSLKDYQGGVNQYSTLENLPVFIDKITYDESLDYIDPFESLKDKIIELVKYINSLTKTGIDYKKFEYENKTDYILYHFIDSNDNDLYITYFSKNRNNQFIKVEYEYKPEGSLTGGICEETLQLAKNDMWYDISDRAISGIADSIYSQFKRI